VDQTPNDIEFHDIAIQADNKIVAMGTTFSNALFGNAFVVDRFNPDGSPDLGFGASGQVATTFAQGESQGLAGTLQADGKIVVAGGFSFLGVAGDFAVARYNPFNTFELSKVGSFLTILGDPVRAGHLDVTDDSAGNITVVSAGEDMMPFTVP